jgi:DNA-binding HxlR family transcriptional regulator
VRCVDREQDLANCSVARTLDVVGDRWSLLVLRDAFNGVRRFDDLQRRLGAARTVLSARLATLVEHGVLDKVPYRDPGQRERFEYRLTEMGRDLQPVVLALLEFGDRHLADPEGPPVEVRHDCGAAVHVALVCEDGHHVGSPKELRSRPGPGARFRDPGPAG